MEMKQLEIFACVSRNLSFSRAAEELYISQPSVSASISALERSLGVQLFLRTTKEVALTKAGIEFLCHAKRILSLRDHALQSVKGGDTSYAGTIDIISSTIPAQHLLPELIAAFVQKWPNITFRVSPAQSLCVGEEMRGCRYDFGMVGTVIEGGRFIHCPVYEDELVLALPASLQWADASPSIDDFPRFILQAPFLMRSYGSGTRSEIEALLLKLGIDSHKLKPRAYFPDSAGILLAVSRGLGVSLISSVAASMYEAAGLVRTVGMNDPLFRRTIYLIYNKDQCPTPAGQAFADFARDFYRA